MIPCLLRRALAALLLPPLLAAPLPAAAQEPPRDPAPPAATPQGTSTIMTWVRDEQGKDLPGARVLLTAMEGKSPPLSSNPTDRFGECRLKNVSYGYYRYAVETPAGFYLGNRVLLVPPEREVAIEVDLGPFLPEDEKLGMSKTDPVPGTDKIPIGVARLKEDAGPKGLAWFQTGKGVAVLVGGGILIVAGVILLTDPDNQETSASPSTPSGR
jgi:hypothetical protein